MFNAKKMKVLALVLTVMISMSSVAMAAYVYESRYGHNTLKQGHTGDYVRNLQTDINTTGDGYCGTPDGIFGSGTKGGVIQYQSKNGLTADGQAGYNTKMSLWNALWN